MSSDKKTSLRSASASGTHDSLNSMNKTASPKATVTVAKDLKGASGSTIRPEPSEIDSFREEMRKLFREADEKQSVRIKGLDDKFTKIFENLKADITSVKDEQTKTNETLSSLNKKVEEMEKGLNHQTNRLDDVEKANAIKFKETEENLDKKIAELNKKLLLAEKQDRKYNLLFYGLQPREHENVYERVRELLVKDMSLDETKVQQMYFAHGHRLPSKGIGPDPVIIRFTSWEDRELVLSNAKKLAGSRRRILVDLPVCMKIERDKLAKIAFGVRKNEKLQTRIKDKGLDVYLQVRKDETCTWETRVV